MNRWDALGVGDAEAFAGRSPGNALEQYGAQLRDELDVWGLSTADSDQLYAVLVGQRLLLMSLALGVAAGKVDCSHLDVACSVHRGMIAALLPSIPAGERGR